MKVGQDQWAHQVVERFVQSGTAQELTVSDIDDTLIDSNASWYKDYRQLAIVQGFSQEQIVSRQEFKLKGPRVFMEALNLVPDYDEYKRFYMHNPGFHLGMVAMADAVDVLGGRNTIPHGYISTRPDELYDVTVQNLSEQGFAPTPVLLRPGYIGYKQTIAFKISSLLSVRTALDEARLGSVPLQYVDDYHGVTEAIEELRHPGVTGIHYSAERGWGDIVGRVSA